MDTVRTRSEQPSAKVLREGKAPPRSTAVRGRGSRLPDVYPGDIKKSNSHCTKMFIAALLKTARSGTPNVLQQVNG